MIVRSEDTRDLAWHWKPQALHPARKVMIVFGLLWLVLVLVFAILIAAGVFDLQEMNQPNPFGEIGLWAILAVQLITGGLIFGVPAFWPRQPERLTLTDTALVWDSGSPTLPLAFLAGGLMQFSGGISSDPPPFIWKRRRLNTTRDEVTNVRLDRVGERQRLTVDHGADRLEIGICLREPEREWLAEVLTQWKGEP